MYLSFLLSACAFLLTIQYGLCTNIDRHPSWKYLPRDKCGDGSMGDRIVGGQKASLGQFPWIARIGYRVFKTSKMLYYLCAGSLINRWYILTANHCFRGVLGETIKQVRLGENFLFDDIDCDGEVCAPPVQDIAVDTFVRFVPKKDSEADTYGDIALLRMAAPASFNDFVQPICLPTNAVVKQIGKHLAEGTNVDIAGWGSTAPEVYLVPNHLKYVTMPVVSMNVCRRNFPKNTIDESQICVGLGEGKDTCVGDSGGPLMKAISLHSSPKYYVLGIVSYGMKWCGVSAAVYTNVSFYMDWVLDNIKPDE